MPEPEINLRLMLVKSDKFNILSDLRVRLLKISYLIKKPDQSISTIWNNLGLCARYFFKDDLGHPNLHTKEFFYMLGIFPFAIPKRLLPKGIFPSKTYQMYNFSSCNFLSLL